VACLEKCNKVQCCPNISNEFLGVFSIKIVKKKSRHVKSVLFANATGCLAFKFKHVAFKAEENWVTNHRKIPNTCFPDTSSLISSVQITPIYQQ